MTESIQRIWQRAKIATRFVFGQSQYYSSWGFDNPDEPTAQRQRKDYRGLFFKCLDIRANQVSSAMEEAKVVRVTGPDEFEEVEYDHPWQQFLRDPAPESPVDDYWKLVCILRDLQGHAHGIVGDFDRIMGSKVPNGLLPIFPEFGDLNPVPNKRGGIEAWEYLRSDGQKNRFEPEEVVALQRTSPYNPFKTMSLVQAAVHELDVDRYMKIYRKDSVKDGGITSDIISTEQQMNSTQRDKLSQEFKDYLGQRGKGKVLALSHGMALVKASVDARDLQYIEGNVQNANDLRFITGVPEALYAKDANRAVLEGAERVMIQYTIQPLVNGLCKQLTKELERIFNAEKGVLKVMPPDMTPVDEEMEIRRRESYLATGQRTIDHYRKQDGLDEYPDDIGSEPLIDFSKTTLKEVVTVNDQFDPQGEPPPESNNDEEQDRTVKKKRELDLDYEWRQIDQHRRREEKKTAASVNAMFDRLRELALANIDNKRSTRDDGAQLSVEEVLNLMEAKHVVNSELRDDIIRLIREGFKRGAFNANVQGLEFQMNTPEVKNLLRRVAGKTEGIADTTFNGLSEAIKEGVQEGESLEELTDRVGKYFKEAKRSRTKKIAQTMTTSSFEGGQLVSFKQAGATAKSWLSQRDGNVREAHENADRYQNEIALNEPFIVGGEELMHPGDPDGRASNTIFCRCSMLPVINDNEDEE